MKKLIIAIAALGSLSAYALEVNISRFWAPNQIEKCDQSKINYTIYKLISPKITEVSNEEVSLSLSVKFFRCLNENGEIKYRAVNPLVETEVPYKRYDPESGSLYDDVYVSEYERIEFLGYSDDYQLLLEKTLRNNTLQVTVNIADSADRDGKVKVNLAPRVTTVLSDLEGEELFRETKLWNPISIELDVK